MKQFFTNLLVTIAIIIMAAMAICLLILIYISGGWIPTTVAILLIIGTGIAAFSDY